MSQSHHSQRNTRGEISSQKSEAVSLGEGEDEEHGGERERIGEIEIEGARHGRGDRE